MAPSKVDLTCAQYQLHFLSLLCLIESSETPQKRRFWERKYLRERSKYGLSSSLVPELRQHDPGYFAQFLRMPIEVFSELLKLVEPGITKRNTRWREAISAHDRFCVTLRFLATGETFRSLGFSFRMGRTTVTNIIRETSEEIWKCLKDTYVKAPETKAEWKEIANDFLRKWQLPNCCGSIGGKHVSVQCPPKSGSLNFCYKGHFSKILMAVADAQYRFLLFSFGYSGSESDGGVFQKCSFGKNILQNSINLPNSCLLPNSCVDFPHYFVADEAFPLRHNLMRPYPRRSATTNGQKIFNYRLSRARQVVENAFGILAARFRIFQRPLNYDNSKTLLAIVAASIALHNFLIMKCSEFYIPTGFVDNENCDHNLQPGQWRSENVNFQSVKKQGGNSYSNSVKELREKLKNYLCLEGAVEWQNRHINVV